MIKTLSTAAILFAATAASANAHEIVAEHGHAGPVVFEALPLPLIALGLIGAAILGCAILLQRRSSRSTRDER
jgi:uncharacterized membrane protein